MTLHWVKMQVNLDLKTQAVSALWTLVIRVSFNVDWDPLWFPMVYASLCRCRKKRERQTETGTEIETSAVAHPPREQGIPLGSFLCLRALMPFVLSPLKPGRLNPLIQLWKDSGSLNVLWLWPIFKEIHLKPQMPQRSLEGHYNEWAGSSFTVLPEDNLSAVVWVSLTERPICCRFCLWT